MLQLQFIKIIKVTIATRLCQSKLIYQSFFLHIYPLYDFSSYVMLESLQSTAKKIYSNMPFNTKIVILQNYYF